MSFDRIPASLSAGNGAAAADWVAAALRPWPTPGGHVEVGSLVPDGFGAYLAIRHASGMEDDLSSHEARSLSRVLAEFTETADDCWFCIWKGYGDIEAGGRGDVVVRTPGREYLLFRGPLAAVGEFRREQPQLWWPADRQWCVGSDMDLARTFIGGTDECVAAIAATELDAERVTPDVTVDETNDLPRLTERE